VEGAAAACERDVALVRRTRAARWWRRDLNKPDRLLVRASSARRSVSPTSGRGKLQWPSVARKCVKTKICGPGLTQSGRETLNLPEASLRAAPGRRLPVGQDSASPAM